MYNRFTKSNDKITPTNINQSTTLRLKITHDEIQQVLDEVIAIGNAGNITTAKYFKTLTTYELGFMQATNKENVTALATLEGIKTDMLNFQESDFKKYYKYENVLYSIAWENIAPKILEYYSAMAELYILNNKNAAAFSLSMEGLVFDYTAENENFKTWNYYLLSVNHISAANQMRSNTAESADIAILNILYYASLTQEYKDIIAGNNRYGYSSAYNYILNLKANNEALVKDGGLYARTAVALLLNNDIERGPDMFKMALENGYYESNFIIDAYAMADLANNNALGLLAAEKQEPRISESDCQAWVDIATKWSKYGNISKSNAALAKSRVCEMEAQAIQRAYEKQQAREARRAERDFSIYAGIYPLPMIIRFDKYRDYGGVVGFGVHNFAMEFSYKFINLNHVIYDDLFLKEIEYDGFENYWNGYRAHVAFKFGDRDTYGEGGFVGPLFEVVSRNFEPVKSDVFAADGFTYLRQSTFSPTELSYNVFLNMGGRIEQNNFMVEYFLGIGGAYHQFDGGGEEYNNDLFYLSNPVLENRTPTRFGVAVRMGMTMGLSTRN
jgi:hypothetical protein